MISIVPPCVAEGVHLHPPCGLRHNEFDEALDALPLRVGVGRTVAKLGWRLCEGERHNGHEGE
jgi:hypothetical protein